MTIVPQASLFGATTAPAAPTYDRDEWYTPTAIIAAARVSMGGIDLDPASCDVAQNVVQAERYYTKEDNGLAQPWCNVDGTPARVWLNPPYSQPLMGQFTHKLLREHACGHVQQAVMLVNNCTDTAWFCMLAEHFPVAFTRKRIIFWWLDRGTGATRQGQALFYIGPNVSSFYQAFQHIAYVPNEHVGKCSHIG